MNILNLNDEINKTPSEKIKEENFLAEIIKKFDSIVQEYLIKM